MSILREIRESFHNDGIVNRLIIVNVVIFLILALSEFFVRIGTAPRLAEWVAMPTSFGVFLRRPWTIFTYMFAHVDLIHVLFNMFSLYWFGRLASHILGEHLVMRIYLIGGLAGGLACFICSLIWPSTGGYLIGASASIVALLTAVATYYPNYIVHLTFIGDVRLKYYALFFILLFAVMILQMNNIGGNIAHLGGMLAGYLLALVWKKNGLPTSKWHIFSVSKPKKMNVVYGDMASDIAYNEKKVEHSREIDRILDKIKESGYDSLTSSEKQTLFRESNR